MTMLYRTTEKCAVCGTESEHIGIASWSTFEAPHLDLREDYVHQGVLNAWLHECPGCHFVAADLSAVTAEEAEVRNEPGFTEAGRADGMPDLAIRYMRRAYVDERAGQPRKAIHRLLRAAWVLDDLELDASSVRMKAADMIRALGPEVEVELQLLRLDMLRRAKAFAETVDAADELLSKQLDPFHRKVAAIQRRVALEEQAQALSLSDAAKEPDPT